MHLIEIPEIKFAKEVPSEISELTTEQYLYFCRQFLSLQEGEITYPVFRVMLLSHFLDLRPSLWPLSEYEAENINAKLYQISEVLDSFVQNTITEGVPQFNLNLSFIRNLVPFVKIGGCMLYGPSDALTDTCFQEYIDAYHYYLEYLDSQDETALNYMIAVLYRPRKNFLWIRKRLPGNTGQKRQKLTINAELLGERARMISRLPFYIRFAIFLFFRGCEEFLRNGEIPLGGSMIKFSLLYEGTHQGEGDDTGLIGILYTLAESQVFGNAEQTANTNLYDVMVRIYQLMQSLKRQETKANDSGKEI